MLMVMVPWVTLPLAGAIGAAAPALAGVDPVAASVEVPASEEEWPLFRGDSHLSGIASSALPADLELSWTYDAGKAITSSPVVAGGRVFFGADDHAVHCADASSGEPV